MLKLKRTLPLLAFVPLMLTSCGGHSISQFEAKINSYSSKVADRNTFNSTYQEKLLASKFYKTFGQVFDKLPPDSFSCSSKIYDATDVEQTHTTNKQVKGASSEKSYATSDYVFNKSNDVCSVKTTNAQEGTAKNIDDIAKKNSYSETETGYQKYCDEFKVDDTTTYPASYAGISVYGKIFTFLQQSTETFVVNAVNQDKGFKYFFNAADLVSEFYYEATAQYFEFYVDGDQFTVKAEFNDVTVVDVEQYTIKLSAKAVYQINLGNVFSVCSNITSSEESTNKITGFVTTEKETRNIEAIGEFANNNLEKFDLNKFTRY